MYKIVYIVCTRTCVSTSDIWDSVVRSYVPMNGAWERHMLGLPLRINREIMAMTVS